MTLSVSEPHQIVGSIPAWLQLGPVVDRDGAKVREVLGDWSHLNECDRPPAYVLDGLVMFGSSKAFDRSAERPSVRQWLAGRDVKSLKDRARKVAVLFNGESLKSHDLHQIRKAGIPIIGMNRTHVGHPGYEGPEPDYLCAIDFAWIEDERVRKHPGLVNGSTHEDNVGFRATRSFRMTPFSFDMGRDGFVPFVPGTTGFLALQLAVYMGFTEIYCLGLDLHGPHFDGTRASYYFAQMRRQFERVAEKLSLKGINAYVCGSPTSKAPFEHRTFEELVA